MAGKSNKQLLSAQTYRLIKSDIVTCELEPGQQIVQAELAEKYEVGVTPVREALRQLAQEGFVQPIPRMGYIVSLITEQDVHEIYEMRSILETASVRLAAARGQDDQLKAIAQEAHFTYTYKDRKSYTQFLNRNADFHRSIAAVSGNQRLVDQISRALDELNRVFHLGLDLRDSAEEMTTDHVALAAALCIHDASLAVQHVQEEISRSKERVIQALKKYHDLPVSSANRFAIYFSNKKSTN